MNVGARQTTCRPTPETRRTVSRVRRDRRRRQAEKSRRSRVVFIWVPDYGMDDVDDDDGG